ncbi:MAG: HORMA domain containing protein [Armatimonadetes bacterium]|nr:HORMA domain containing protein [Armatimonadota bacterium]
MSATTVSVSTYTHSVTFVTDNILKTLKDIIVLSGLSPEKMTTDWHVLHSGISTWIHSGHLERVTLEVYNTSSDALIGRWDIDISYEWSGGNGRFWVDTDQIRNAIKKSGIWPSSAAYAIKVKNSSGEPYVAGWGDCNFRSTQGFVRQSLGTNVEHSGLGGSASYYRKVS